MRFFLTLAIIGLMGLPPLAKAQVLATEVARSSWTIDAQTAKQGITLQNGNGTVRLGLNPQTVAAGTTVDIITYASEYFVNGSGRHRVTPLYRIVVKGESSGENFPLEIRHHGEDLGKKTLQVWGADDVWRTVGAQSVPEKNLIRAKIGIGETYLAVFADDQVLETGLASWYNYKQCHCAASPDYPKGTKLKVTNVKNGKMVTVRVNDYGPDRAIHPDRVVDLDREAFLHLADPKKGLVRVSVEKL